MQKKSGKRMTKIRKILFLFLEERKEPFSVEEIAEYLKRFGVTCNLTTLYRQVHFLRSEGMIKESDIPGQVQFYEVSSNGHHHHFFCEICNKKQCLEEKRIENILKRVMSFLNTQGLEVRSHSFSFSGVCRECLAVGCEE